MTESKTMSALLENLQKFYWSPKQPEEYVLPNGTGIGRIAKEDYAAFNLAWAYTAPLDSYALHVQAVTIFTQARLVANQIVGDDNLMLRDVLTMTSLYEFMAWYKQCRAVVSTEAAALLDFVLDKHQDAHNDHLRKLR